MSVCNVILDLAEPLLQKELDTLIETKCISEGGHTKRFVDVMNAYSSYFGNETDGVKRDMVHKRIFHGMTEASRFGGLFINVPFNNNHLLFALNPILQYYLIHIPWLDLSRTITLSLLNGSTEKCTILDWVLLMRPLTCPDLRVAINRLIPTFLKRAKPKAFTRNTIEYILCEMKIDQTVLRVRIQPLMIGNFWRHTHPFFLELFQRLPQGNQERLKCFLHNKNLLYNWSGQSVEAFRKIGIHLLIIFSIAGLRDLVINYLGPTYEAHDALRQAQKLMKEEFQWYVSDPNKHAKIIDRKNESCCLIC
jgi:hypothetical protein